MSLGYYDIIFQNGLVTKASMILNDNLYNKILHDSPSGLTVVATGDINTIKQYLGSEFFRQYLILYTDNVNSPSVIAFNNAFPNSRIIEISSPYEVYDTHGKFKIIGSAAGNQWWYCPAYPQGSVGASPLTYTRLLSDQAVFYNVLSESLFLNSKSIKCQLVYNPDTQVWTLSVGLDNADSWNVRLHASQEGTNVYNFLTSNDPTIFDPYGDGGTSGEGGGNGNFSENSDGVSEDAMPDETNYSAIACGLVTVFNPTKAQLKKLADVILGNGFWNFVQNMVENISDLFISLGMVPFNITPGSAVEVTWWGYTGGGLEPGTGVYLNLAPHQYYEFDMGSINMSTDTRIFSSDSVLDYSPFSKLGIYLPFIGYQELDIDECRGQIIKLKYRIDILSGTCVAIITLNNDGIDRAIYQFTGNCLTQIPLTSVDASSMITNAVNIGVAAFSAGATQAVASAGDALTAENLADPKSHLTATGAELQNKQHAASVSNAAGSLASSTVGGVMGMKPNYKHSGAVSSSASLFGVKQPYLFLTTPRQSYPANYSHYCGFPCNITDTLGNFSGYTVVEDIRLNGLVATSSEVEEIYALLKSGVII